MQLFYNASITKETTNFIFDREESKHIIKVLRKQANNILLVTNGLGYLFKTKITLASDSKCTVEIVGIEEKLAPTFKTHLAVAPTKMNERFEWFLEKATEIGVSEITPIICDHSERKILKTERFEKLLITAMKQSNQCFLPKLNAAILFKDFVIIENDAQKFIAHCEETDKISLKTALYPNKNVLIMIGPEGDFSEKEIKFAIENNFKAVTLGNNRLRTETAAIVACHSVIFVNEI